VDLTDLISEFFESENTNKRDVLQYGHLHVLSTLRNDVMKLILCSSGGGTRVALLRI